MDIPLEFFSVVVGRDLEQELHGAGAVICVDEGDLGAVDFDGFAEREGDYEGRGDVEDLLEEAGGGGRAVDDAAAPGGGEAGVVVGVEVGEEVGDGEVAGVAEGVDEEAGFGDEFGVGDGGGNVGEREREWRLVGLGGEE